MKKYFLLFALIFMSSTGAFAQNWVQLETKTNNVSLEIDKDAVRFLNDYTCLYALRLTRIGGIPKAVFVKADFKESKMGVVEVEDFNTLMYNPQKVFINSDTFLKPINPTSLLAVSYNYVNDIYNTRVAANSYKVDVTKKDVSYRNQYKAKNKNEYINIIAKELYKNWEPPKSAQNSSAIIIVQIARDGSLQNYVFAQKSQDSANNRSIMAAVEKAVPYGIFPDDIKTDKIDLQFIFEYKKFRKSVK